MRITVTCCETLVGEQCFVCVSVRDNGPGLDGEQHQRIFEPFYTTKSNGTGLGMAIVRRIIEAHDGEVEVDPGPGRGVEVRIRIPRAQA